MLPAPVPPEVLKDISVLDGWSVVLETDLHWRLDRSGQQLIIPKDGDYVSVEVLTAFLHKTDMDWLKDLDLAGRARHDFYQGRGLIQ